MLNRKKMRKQEGGITTPNTFSSACKHNSISIVTGLITE
jgi:hypothetical protein